MADETPQSAESNSEADKSTARVIDWRRTHLWQIQPVRDVLLVFFVFGLLYLGSVLSIVTVPLLLALLLAYLFEPVVRWLCARSERISRQGAASIIIVAVLLIGVVALAGLSYGVAQGYHAASNFVSNVRQVQSSVMEVRTLQQSADESADESTDGNSGAAAEQDNAVEARTEALRNALPTDLWREIFDNALDAGWALDEQNSAPGEDSETAGPRDPVLAFLRSSAEAIDPSSIGVSRVVRPTVRAGAEVIRATLGFVGTVVLTLMSAFFTGFFFFFISTGYPAVVERIRSLIPDAQRDRAIDLGQKFDRVINAFIRGRLTVAFVLGGVLSVAYFLIGVPGAFIVGPIVGVLSVVPYLSLVGIPITVLLMLLDPGGFFGFQSHWLWAILAPTAVYFLAQSLDDYVLTPIIQGKATNMDTPTILFATLAGGALAGFYGVLLAIPVAACAKIALTELFWPRFKAWTEGKEPDFLPIGRD